MAGLSHGATQQQTLGDHMGWFEAPWFENLEVLKLTQLEYVGF